MSDKATLLREADEAFAELRLAVEDLTDEEMRRVWLGTWGVREILIHISGWQEFVGAARAVPELHFVPGGAARQPFEGAGAGHYREHAAQIREWRQPPPGR